MSNEYNATICTYNTGHWDKNFRFRPKGFVFSNLRCQIRIQGNTLNGLVKIQGYDRSEKSAPNKIVETLYRQISPFHAASERPNVPIKFCHLGPPRSFLRIY